MPKAIASSAGAPKPSYRLGNTRATDILIRPSLSEAPTRPIRRARSPKPNSLITSFTRASPSPLPPAITNLIDVSFHAEPSNRNTNSWFLCGCVIAGKNKICEPPSPNLFRSSASLVAPCPISGSRPCRTTQTFSAGTANESMRVLRTYSLGVATAVARRKADGTRLRK